MQGFFRREEMTNAEFAQQVGYVASSAAKWAADSLSLPEKIADPVTKYAMERFLEEMRGRLDRIEEWNK